MISSTCIALLALACSAFAHPTHQQVDQHMALQRTVYVRMSSFAVCARLQGSSKLHA